MYVRTTRILAVLFAFLMAGAVLAAVDPANRTVTTSTLFVDWSETNPEEILDLRWNGSANLTNHAAAPGCAGDREFFGNSVVSQDEGMAEFVYVPLVGWGTSGSWVSPNPNSVSVSSVSSGCLGSANLPVATDYRFVDRGAAVNRIQVRRTFSFGSTPFPYHFRPYVPRLYPRTDFTQVLHPDAAGTVLVAEDVSACHLGCRVDNWNDAWFAVRSPGSGRGLIVRREPSAYDAALWVDQDDASFTNASSVLLLQPDGGFTGRVAEVEYLCFFDSWIPSLTLPPGC